MRPGPLALVLLLVAAPAAAQEATVSASFPVPCQEVVDFSWDVSAVAGATGVRWELKKGEFTNPDGGDPGRIASERVNGVTGTVRIDLRRFGPAATGTFYHFRVIPRGTADLPPSPPTVVGEPIFTADPPTATVRPDVVEFAWSLAGPIAACADRVAFEVRKDGAPLGQGVSPGASGATTFPAQPGTYEARIQPRFGGDGENQAIGHPSAFATATVSAAEPALVRVRARVEDVAFSACIDGGGVAVPGARVRIAGSGVDETKTASGSGEVEFRVAPGAYTLTATVPGTATTVTCPGSATLAVDAAGDAAVTIPMPGCFHPRADVTVAFDAGPSTGAVGTLFPMALTVAHPGFGGPARAGSVRVERLPANGVVGMELVTREIPALCPGRSVPVPTGDLAPPPGTFTYRATLTLADANAATNVATRAVTYGNPTATAVPAPPRGTIAIASFQLQNGAASVPSGTRVSLDATTAGLAPSAYRAAECGFVFDNTTFIRWPPTGRPFLPLTTVGTRTVCLQVRSGTTVSNVAQDAIQVTPLEVAVQGTRIEAAAPDVPVVLESFQIRGGATYARTGAQVPLDWTASGSPTEFRSIQPLGQTCQQALGRIAWRALSGAPTRTFSTPGRATVCFQVRRGGVESSILTDQIDVIPAEAYLSAGYHTTITNLALSGPSGRGCRDGKSVIGLTFRAGIYIDEINTLCAVVGPNGEHDGVGEPGLLGAGRTTGSPANRPCPSGEVPVGLSGRYGEFLEHASLKCRPWNERDGANGAVRTLSEVGGPGNPTLQSFDLACPDVLAVTYLNVQHRTSIVGRITLICRPPAGI